MKVYYLGTCSTCQRIMANLPLDNFDKQDIKVAAITASQLDEMKRLAGSYEALFSRKAMKYRSLGLNEKELTEADYRQWILNEYTFLKRPVFVIDDNIYIGNSKKVIESVADYLGVL